MKIIVLLLGLCISLFSRGGDGKVEESAKKVEAKDASVEVMLDKVYRDTPVLLCYDDNFRKCYEDKSIESCIVDLRRHDALTKIATDLRFPKVENASTVVDYAAEYTQRTQTVRGYERGKKEFYVSCLDKNPINMWSSMEKIRVDDPKKVQHYMNLK